MKVERLLQISVALLAALGSLLLAIGQGGNSALPLLATMAAFGSVYLTDLRGWIMLNRNLANFAALIAVLFSFFDFWEDGSSSTTKLHAIAKLLIYLQVVLLFQPKTVRVYWHLAVLSLLQVVVAAALNMSVTFGLMLIPYMFTALTALSLFFVYRETLRVDPDLRAAHDAVENRPLFSFLRSRDAGSDAAASMTSPVISLSGQLPANLAVVFSSGKMLHQVLKMGLFTLCATVVLFYSFPRFDRQQISQNFNIGATTGFKDQISLNDMGQILQSDQFVMRVRLTDPNSGALIDTDYEPYYRGTSLSTYFPQSKTWIVGNLPAYQVSELKPPPADAALVRQTIATNQAILFDRTNEGVLLFSMYPAYASENTAPNLVDNQTLGIISMATNTQAHVRQPDQYEAFVDWNPFGLMANVQPVRHSWEDRRFRGYVRSDLSQIPLDKDFADSLFPGLKAVAADIVAELPADPPPSKAEIAKRLERHFVLDGNYTYSLHVSPHLKNPRLDPIEDFVVNHRMGHCEFFASALVIMLRSQGVPARVVVGYKGGEFNSVGGYYAVKQKHAHAWVEAYLGVEDLPIGLDAEDFPNGVWYRLDPTPASRPSTDRKPTGSFTDTLLDWFDYVELAWRDYVVDMNSERQEKDIYGPLTDNLVKPLEGWTSRAQWSRFFREKLAAIGIHMSDEWFNGFASIFTMLVLLVLVVAFELVRSLLRRLWPWMRKLFGKWLPSTQPRVGFYFKAERLLAKAGWQRRPSDTPQEFINRVIADCQSRQVAAPMIPVLREITAWYYQVRFGGQALPPEQLQAVGEHLTIIEQQARSVRNAKR